MCKAEPLNFVMDTSNVSNALDVEVLNAVLRSRRRRRYKRRVDEVDEIMYPNQELIYMPKGL